MIRVLIVLAVPLAASCYLTTEGGELPAGRLDVELLGGLGGLSGHDLLDVNVDGTFEVLSLYDARVCRGVLEPQERQQWWAIVRTLEQPWERPPPDVLIYDGGSRCASLEPGGQSTGCAGDGGHRGQAVDFAHDLRTRIGDDDCEPVSGEPALLTSWSVVRFDGADFDFPGQLTRVEWRGGLARSRPLEEYGEWSDCAAPTSEQRARLDALALAARDAMRFPRMDRWSLPLMLPESGWFELSQLIWVSVSVDSPYGRRGNRLLGVDPDLYRDIGLALADVCGFVIEDPRP